MIFSRNFFLAAIFPRACVATGRLSTVPSRCFQILYAHTVFFAGALMLAQQANLLTLPEWYHLLQDTDALIQEPTKRHRELLHHAYALRDATRR